MELHPVHIEILNALKTSTDGMTRHEIEKSTGQMFLSGHIKILIKYGYIEVVGTKDGYQRIVYPDGDFINYLSQFIKLQTEGEISYGYDTNTIQTDGN